MSIRDKLSPVATLVARRAQSYRSGEGAFSGLYEDTEKTLGLNEYGASVTSVVTGFIALAIVIAIGIIILANVQQAMPAVNESSPYYALQTSLEQTTASGYGLIAIVVIIVAASAIMGAIGLIDRGDEV